MLGGEGRRRGAFCEGGEVTEGIRFGDGRSLFGDEFEHGLLALVGEADVGEVVVDGAVLLVDVFQETFHHLRVGVSESGGSSGSSCV